MIWLRVTLVLVAAAVLAPVAGANDVLPPRVQKALARHGLDADGLSLWVQDVTEREPLIALHPDVARNPASVMKLVTTLAGLELLGPGYRWETQLLAKERIKGERLAGDLYLRGGGDPHLVTESFWRMLRALRAQGLRRIDGDLVIDNSWLDPQGVDPGAFDGRPYRTYNATPAALLLNFKATEFTFLPDRDAGKIRIATEPPAARGLVRNELRIVNGKCRGRHLRIRMHVESTDAGKTARFSGDYPASCGRFTLRRSVFDPQQHVYGAFVTLWREMGGTIGGGVREAKTPSRARRLLRWRSKSLAEQIRSINKHSNNVMTRQLLLTLGAEKGGTPGTVEKGRAAIAGWLADKGLDPGTVFVDNGSGLSRDARITARTLAALLLQAYASPLMPEFVASMPLAAVDGTLKKRFRDRPPAGRVHMKTGLLDHVRSIAGFTLSKHGRTFVVASLHNEPGVHNTAGTKVQDALLEWLHDQ